MTDLPTIPGQGLASATPNLVRRMLDPLDRAERVAAEIADEVRTIRAIVPDYFPRNRTVTAPDVDTAPLEEQAAQLRRMVDAPTDSRAARVGFSLMLEAFPNSAKFDSGVYLDAAIATALADPEGFPPVIIAAAVRRLWRERTFVPAISEILEALRVERRRLQAPMLEADALVKRLARIQKRAKDESQAWNELEQLRALARAAGDTQFDDDEGSDWQDDLERLRRRYGGAR